MLRFYNGTELLDLMGRPRRLLVLVRGLPPDAAVWRADRLPPAEEYAVVLIEQYGQWSRALLDALMGAKRVQIPAQMTYDRPGAPVRPAGNIVTDPAELRRWFARNT